VSYDPSLPTARDRVRFTVGDTASPELRPDTEYDALIAQYDERTATLKMAESLASQYAQDPSSISVGGLSVSFSDLVKNWQQLAAALRQAIKDDPATSLSTLQVGRLQRLEDTGESEYRRPWDWVPDDDYGDGW
jgi:hypothetical protein